MSKLMKVSAKIKFSEFKESCSILAKEGKGVCYATAELVQQRLQKAKSV